MTTMLSRLRRHLLAGKMKRLIKRATTAIYSGCAEPLDVQDLAIKIVNSNRSGALLRAFIAIRFAAEAGREAPYNGYMTNKILNEVLSGDAELAMYDPEPILGLQKARAGVALAERQVHFFLGRIAYEAEA